MAIVNDRERDDGKKEERPLRWSLGATGVAIILWGIISLSESYVWGFDVPLSIRIDTTSEALAASVPRTLRVRAVGDGWSLMQMVLDDDLECDLDPRNRASILRDDSLREYRFSEQDLISRINAPRAVQIRDINPERVTVAVTDLARKRVPLTYDQSFKIKTRQGFQVIGRPSVYPDSVTLSGAPEALEKVSFWRTQPLPLEDLHAPLQTVVPVDDTLHGVITVIPEAATVAVNVQEVAELRLENLLVINRATQKSDSTQQLRLYPARVTITLRGGAGELGRLREESVIPFVNLLPGIDTSGYVVPRVTLPPFSNASVISIEPERIRYVWRRPLAVALER